MGAAFHEGGPLKHRKNLVRFNPSLSRYLSCFFHLVSPFKSCSFPTASASPFKRFFSLRCLAVVSRGYGQTSRALRHKTRHSSSAVHLSYLLSRMRIFSSSFCWLEFSWSRWKNTLKISRSSGSDSSEREATARSIVSKTKPLIELIQTNEQMNINRFHFVDLVSSGYTRVSFWKRSVSIDEKLNLIILEIKFRWNNKVSSITRWKIPLEKAVCQGELSLSLATGFPCNFSDHLECLPAL